MADQNESNILFELRNVSFEYASGVCALQDISFNIHSGERLALLGCNGSGKSTLLRLLDGLAICKTGTIKAFGVELTSGSLSDRQYSVAFRQRVGFIFQRSEVQLFSSTVQDEIAFGPLQLGLPAMEAAQRVEDVLKLLQIVELRDRAPFQLSGGEQKKVAIASVIAVNPDVLLMDEPTAALDPRSQRWFIDLLQQLQNQGKTTIIATHDLHLLHQLASTVAVLSADHGILRHGPIEDVMTNHDLLHAADLSHYHWPPHDTSPVP